MKNTNVAIIPIRDNSKRLKKKNFLKIKKKKIVWDCVGYRKKNKFI